MKKIHNIIQSELVVRTNNVKFKQEFGELGVSPNIRNEGDSTIFTTEFGIDKIIYLTVNGVNLIEGVHFYVVDEFHIHISNNGDPLNVFSNQAINILVVYMRNNKRFNIRDIKIPPIITSFYLDKTEGVDEKIVFNFAIEPRDGKNIYWSILKDGGEVPLYSGSSLQSNNGHAVDSSGNLIELKYYVTNAEYLERIGEDMNFTLVVIYDLTEDGSILDEKLLKDAKYTLLNIVPISGSITSLPAYISVGGFHDITIDYSVLNPSGNAYQWRIARTYNNANRTILDSGNTGLDISGSIVENIEALEGVPGDYRYYLEVQGPSDLTFYVLSNDRTTVNVPIPSLKANVGYLDEAIMNYQDGAGTWRKIGWSGTAQDVVEYNNRVPSNIFTEQVEESILDSGVVVSPPVYNPSGTILKVHFVIEVPEAWGPIKLVQPLGVVDPSAINVITLGNGYVAYIYAALSSSVSNPSEYSLERA